MVKANIDTALIQKTDLFKNLPQDEIDFIVSHSEILKLSKGRNLFISGEKARQFYILTSGAIRVYKPKGNSIEEEMASFTAGDTIGDFDFARGAEYDACAEASKDSELIAFPGYGYTMDSLAMEKPGITCNILLNAIVMMTGRIKSVNKLLLENMSWVQELHRQVYEDSGTGLWKQSLIKDEIIGVLKKPSALIMLKPDRFKILNDSWGHAAGDEAMLRIALILRNITRFIGHGWPLRFKSNEVGLIFNDCDASQAEDIVRTLNESIIDMEPVPAKDDISEFRFSATISWAIWPYDDPEWSSLFQGNYASLLDNWHDGGERTVRYCRKTKA
jgi:diguanylate cyclase (GGDEF)-like protein